LDYAALIFALLLNPVVAQNGRSAMFDLSPEKRTNANVRGLTLNLWAYALDCAVT
jgi:hypothetical protein